VNSGIATTLIRGAPRRGRDDVEGLPDRYAVPWRRPFYDYVARMLPPGAAILDVGSGRSPAIPADLRPPDCRYVGLDISARELAAAPVGSYDETVVADLLEPRPELAGRFDLVVSWQVLEHVDSLVVALDSIHMSLRGGGHLAALLSGRWALFAVANRLIPSRIGVRLMGATIERDPETVFPARYDRATMRELTAALGRWTAAEVLPCYRGAGYLCAFPRLQALYLAYEGWARESHPNLATHYLVFAEK
jgi:2-polyprenyl-6-hydroxyphenyl methylase/3-demethylubiquinone-9 3-methyltransferase